MPTYSDTFVEGTAWDRYSGETLIINVAGEMLRGFLAQPGRYAWSLNHITHHNVEIEMTVHDLGSHPQAFMGVMCRASAQNNGRGYHFLISADGAYSIRYGIEGSSEALIRWQNHRAVRPNSSNRLRVVCDGAQLTFAANGQRLASIRDERYSSGSVGVLIGLPAAISATATVDVAFDDLHVWHLP